VTLLPYIEASGELKSKPTQHSVMKLREIGLAPDMILCRSAHPIEQSVRDKIALFCNVRSDHVIEGRDVPSIYEVPLAMHQQNAGQLIKERLNIEKIPRLDDLKKFIHNFKNPKEIVTIAMCGKYNSLHDAYKSILEAFIHAGIFNDAKINIKWVDTELLEKNMDECLSNAKLQDRILNERIEAQKKYKISSTPTIYINNKKYEGKHNFKSFKKALERIL